jgi:hypothetical protein
MAYIGLQWKWHDQTLSNLKALFEITMLLIAANARSTAATGRFNAQMSCQTAAQAHIPFAQDWLQYV